MVKETWKKTFVGALLLLCFMGCEESTIPLVWPSDDATPTEFSLAMNAKILCSGIWVQGRDPEVHIASDLRRFDHFSWADDFGYEINEERKQVTLSSPRSEHSRTAQHNGDQGCSALPRGMTDIEFTPSEVGRAWPDLEGMAWPMGDALLDAELPSEVDTSELESALDWAMANHEHGQNTRAFMVVYKGRIIGERYAPNIPMDMPHLSWSQGKSITAALIGVLIQQGALTLHQAAPIAEWRGDEREKITIANLLRMSSGLDFNNYGLGNENSLSTENHHFRIYFDGINVFEHAIDFPLSAKPGTRWSYLNSDPLTLGRIIRETVEARGEDYHDFPWVALFDRIGIRNAVLETDAWGNFILTGYDYMSARDWARFGQLHLQDGVWEGSRILPEGWVDFVRTPAPASEASNYGGQFWLNAGGEYDRIPLDAFWPSGFMGQNTVIIPSRDLVIVRLGPSPGGGAAYMNEYVGRVLDAIGPAGTQ